MVSRQTVIRHLEKVPDEAMDELSARTVEMMDRSIENLNKGVAGEPLDLSQFRD
jgi:hypothetical protein